MPFKTVWVMSDPFFSSVLNKEKEEVVITKMVLLNEVSS